MIPLAGKMGRPPLRTYLVAPFVAVPLLASVVPLLLGPEEQRGTMLLCAAWFVCTTLCVGLAVAQVFARSIGSMARASSEMLEGNYEQRIAPSPIRELDDLGATINRLAEQVEIQVQELISQAFYDELTGLPNRALFVDRLRHALARSRRHDQGVAVLFLDLDNFKVINDSLGHATGDQLLAALAGRLQDAVRPGDTVARLGGDEFTILVDDVADVADLVAITERLLELLGRPFRLDEREVFATVSIGVAQSTPGEGDGDDLLRYADLAMYQAKGAGKNRYALFDAGMNEVVLERLALETDLRRALERGEFRVFYQPVVRIEDGRISEVEALVRWRHPVRGLVPPAQFIGIAEKMGLIIPIGQWVLEEACRQVQEWRDQQPECPLRLSVNLSARQFQHPGLLEDVRGVLESTGLDPTYLKLEITESVMMQDPAAAVQTLLQLKNLGIQVAIDDFGTGYSSLAQLQRLPVDILKIDRSFVDRLTESPKDEAIVRSIIDLANTLNLWTTGEGIETAEQLQRLSELGCTYGQGYYFARPMPGHALLPLLMAGLPLHAPPPAGAGAQGPDAAAA